MNMLMLGLNFAISFLVSTLTVIGVLHFGADKILGNKEPVLKIALVDMKKHTDSIMQDGLIGTKGISGAADLSRSLEIGYKKLSEEGYLVLSKNLVFSMPNVQGLEVIDATERVIEDTRQYVKDRRDGFNQN